MSVVDPDSIRELYFTYLGMSQKLIIQSFSYDLIVRDASSTFVWYFEILKVFFIFIGLKAYFSIAELRKAANPAKQFLSPPEFGEKENKTISCDLSQKVIIYFFEISAILVFNIFKLDYF